MRPSEDKLVRGLVRGLSRTLTLWLLSSEPRTGYELSRELERLTSCQVRPSFIYPFLHRLESKGLVVGNWVKRKGRDVKYYVLTDDGRSLLNVATDLFNRPIKAAFQSFVLGKSRED